MTGENGQIVDADVVEVGHELAVQPPSALFRTDDPVEVLAQATKVADALKGVVKKQGLIVSIRGKEHPRVEAWQTLGAMLGVFPIPAREVQRVPWPDPVPDDLKALHKKGLAYGFEAFYRAQRADGSVVGGGEAMCTRSEGRPWKDGDDYALKSMAQTRAISKALSGPLRFVMTLAGYEGTPAEEMPRQAAQQAPVPQGKLLTDAQRARVVKAIEESDNRVDLVLAAAGVSDPAELTDLHAKQIKTLLDGGAA